MSFWKHTLLSTRNRICLIMNKESLKEEYKGETASEYEDRRVGTEKWEAEQKAVDGFLTKITAEDGVSSVLDVPVGTGRFFDIYGNLNLEVLGLDISEDMLEQANSRIDDANITTEQGDIFQLAEEDLDADVIVCMRLTNWLEMEEFSEALRNISSVEPRYVIIGVRTENPPSQTEVNTTGSDDTDDSGVLYLAKRSLQVIREDGPVGFATAVRDYLDWRLNGRSIIVHERSAVLDEFDEHGYDIAEKELVDEGKGNRYYIYLLEPKD